MSKVFERFGLCAPTDATLENFRRFVIQNHQDMVGDLSSKQELMVVENSAAVARHEKKRKSTGEIETGKIDLDSGTAVINLDCGSSASTVTDQEEFDDHYGNGERGRALGRAEATRHNKAQRLEHECHVEGFRAIWFVCSNRCHIGEFPSFCHPKPPRHGG